MKKTSYQRELVYQGLVDEMSSVVSQLNAQASYSKYIRLFCMYLANYTAKSTIDEIDQSCVKDYFTYLTKSHKRLSITLSDIKKSMQMISDALQIDFDQSINDFSMTNSDLWNNLK
ncbi:swarming motility protein SwrAA [Metabacillus sp. HB246100]